MKGSQQWDQWQTVAISDYTETLRLEQCCMQCYSMLFWYLNPLTIHRKSFSVLHPILNHVIGFEFSSLQSERFSPKKSSPKGAWQPSKKSQGARRRSKDQRRGFPDDCTVKSAWSRKLSSQILFLLKMSYHDGSWCCYCDSSSNPSRIRHTNCTVPTLQRSGNEHKARFNIA